MSIIKKINVEELNSNLSSIATTIKSKSGILTELTFPEEFITEIQNCYSVNDWFDLNKPVGNIYYTDASLKNYCWQGRKNIQVFFAPNLTSVTNNTGGCGMTKGIFPKVNTTYTSSFYNCTKLTILDFGGTPTSTQGFIRATTFSGDTKLSTIILRANTVWTLSNINSFTNTPFAEGKAGGALYVPQAQIENYQSATNWSTVLSYIKSDETLQNQILPIEGSIYETQYADGTPIPSAAE